MTTYAYVSTWQLWRRHRWGWIVIATWLASVCAYFQIGARETTYFAIVPLGIIPFVLIFLYLIAVLSNGMDADVLSRQSCIPARTYLLPVPTRDLVIWPMLCGAIVIAGLWTTFAQLVLRRFGIEASWWWPPLQMITALAWFQAILWTSFRLPGLRLIALSALLLCSSAFVTICQELELPQWSIAALLLGLLAAAWLTAYRGVRRARSEREPESWHWDSLLDRARTVLAKRSRAFTSGEQAQLWIDWIKMGANTWMQVGALSITLLAMLPLGSKTLVDAMTAGVIPGIANVSPQTSAVLFILGACLLMLPLSAFATIQAKACFPSNNSYRAMSLFYATRPMTSARFVLLKHRTALLSTVLTLTAMLAMIGVYLWLTGKHSVLVELRRGRLATYQTWEIVLLCAGSAFGIILVTWMLIISGLFLNFSGRRWVVLLAMGIVTCAVIAFTNVVYWLTYVHPEHSSKVWRITFWLGLALVILKLVAAVWTLRALRRRRWLRSSILICTLSVWSLVVVGATFFFDWLWPNLEVELYQWAMAAVLFVPLTRVGAAPIMLAWNRHR